MAQVPGIARMLNAGWARHLPPDLTYAFLAAAAVSVGKCTGDLMLDNIQDLWTAQKNHQHQIFPPSMAEELERRFHQEYGRSAPRTCMGALYVLIDLGLLEQVELDWEVYLQVPDPVPTPDSRLVLSKSETRRLKEHLGIDRQL